MNIPVMDKTGEGEDGLMFEDATLVIYAADAEHAAYEPKTEWARQLGVTSFSLWARFDDAEVPIWHQAEEGAWLSLSATVYSPDPADEVSDAFVECVATMPDEDVGDGWGAVPESVFEEATDIEKVLIHHLRYALFEIRPPEAMGVFQWSTAQFEDGDADE